jgi:hypothetical protein
MPFWEEGISEGEHDPDGAWFLIRTAGAIRICRMRPWGYGEDKDYISQKAISSGISSFAGRKR